MINVIGIGQNINTMTLEAYEAIKNSDIIIGYNKYTNEISKLIEGKEIIQKGMGDEISRVEMAISKSIEGNKVALISSGDPGVFGMSNVLFQILDKYNEEIEIKVYPGVSAVNYASSLLGAPLNDFAVISLSNVLTPLSEIEKKIEYSLKANLVLAIYNPISKTRKKPFRQFKKLVLDIKGEDTLVGIVNSEEYPSKVSIVRIKDLLEDEINMSTTLIVGNDLTYEIDGHLITPRGYVIRSPQHPLSIDFYEKFLEGKSPCGPDRECEFYPCHYDGQCCDFCYCPFYPCGDSSTGGRWIKGKNVWNCKDCLWIHDEDTIKCVKEPLEEIIESPEDLEKKKKTLLKLRRACLLNNDPNNL
ncbi:precorrin-3B C(17)-methyltransferase [Methanobrevibacter sp. DSM 116169]|uniref:precorrin-3B C(17)-methyltransferase n=1 Tax=Methanobrevibacter sp. DSM 116169 TaxID=3242727 RepID=UPI0038FC2558